MFRRENCMFNTARTCYGARRPSNLNPLASLKKIAVRLDLEAFPYPGAPYPSMRHPVFGARSMIATSQPLAAQAGLAILRRGGDAVDAAIAASLALTVVEPMNSGIGGDLFALVWDGHALHGVNGSGRSPAALNADHVRAAGHANEMPERDWRWSFESLERDLTLAEFAVWASAFAPDGRPPAAGEIWRCPDLAKSLRLVAETEGNAVYTGELAYAIERHAAEAGGLLTVDDLARHAAEWVAPIKASYRGCDVWEIPPNGQGLAALIALNILDGFDLHVTPRDSGASYQRQIEAMKLAFVDAQRFVADPEHADIPVEALLSQEYAASRRSLIGERALDPEPGEPLRGGASYLCVADQKRHDGQPHPVHLLRLRVGPRRA
jgi:gamma-glutamyltranspeptidase / glutathione hydrolase